MYFSPCDGNIILFYIIPQIDITFYLNHKKTKYSFVKKSIKPQNKKSK